MTAAIAGVGETKFGYPETCRTLVKLWRSHSDRIMSAVNCCACSLCPSTAVLLSNKCFTWRVFSLTKNPLCPPALMVPQAGLGRTQKKIVSQPPPPASLSLSLSLVEGTRLMSQTSCSRRENIPKMDLICILGVIMTPDK